MAGRVVRYYAQRALLTTQQILRKAKTWWYMYIILCMGSNRNFSRGGGQTARTDKIDLFFGAPKARTKIFAILRHFRLNLRIFDASAEGASENFEGVFHGNSI